MNNIVYQIHEMANLFPEMQGKDLEELIESIKTSGLQQPIVLYQGKILDGRNRYKACGLAGVEPTFIEPDISDPFEYVAAANLYRRHLTIEQRAMISARIANMKSGTRTDLEPSANLRQVSLEQAAKIMKVSARSVDSARKILRSGNKQVIADVEAGKMSLNMAVKVIEQTVPMPSFEKNLPAIGIVNGESVKFSKEAKKYNERRVQLEKWGLDPRSEGGDFVLKMCPKIDMVLDGKDTLSGDLALCIADRRFVQKGEMKHLIASLDRLTVRITEYKRRLTDKVIDVE